MTEEKSFEDYSKMITDKNCRWCGEQLDVNNIEYYPHDGGWIVKGFKEKLWLYITCKCKYQWALWKLGVPRE